MPEHDESQLIAQYFQEQGVRHVMALNDTLVIDGPDNVWFVQSGQVEMFAIRLERGQPAGARSHVLSINPGSLVFGMDFADYGQGFGFMLIGTEGSELYRLTKAQLRALASRREQAAAIGQLIDTWLLAFSESVVRDVRPKPKADEIVVGGRQLRVMRGGIARAKKEIVWVQVMKGEALYIGMEGVSIAGEGVPILPLSPETWIEAYDNIVLHCFSTAAILGQATFWHGVDLFHEVLCQCEFINKKLRLVDEFNRLRMRESFAERSKEVALRDIASVLEHSRNGATGTAGFDGTDDPLVSACRLVGGAAGLKIVVPPNFHRVKQRLTAIAKASRFRFRVVALRDNWWETDHDPLLAYRDPSGDPVAILKTKTNDYEIVDPRTQERQRIDARTAATLRPFAAVFYAPLPERKLKAFDLIKFGVRDSKLDLWAILGIGVLVGLLGMVTPYFSSQIFDSVIPAADRPLLLQFTVGLIAAGLGTFAFELVRAISVLRLAGKMDYLVQAGVWDRLLDLPSLFFRAYSAGDLSDRAMGVDQIRQAVSQAGTQAIVGSISAVIMMFFLFTFNWQMALVGLALIGLAVLFPLGFNLLQVKFQRKLFHVRGSITGLVLQLINGVSKLRVSGAEDRAFREWARKFAGQKRLALISGKLTNVIQVFNQSFPVISSAVLFATYAWFQHAAAVNNETFRMSTGQFIAFNTTFTNILSAFLSLSAASLELMIIFPLFERLMPILEAVPEIDEAKAHPGELSGELEVYHITFRYSPDGPAILRDVSFRIKPGEFIALVGGSGSGKSTLLRLLLGFEKPESGSVFYDGQDLSSLDLREVRQQIGVVLQSSKLMPTDIYRNIIGSHQLSLNDAWDAARMAGLDKDIKNMPMGMNTVVSEGGSTFSGGQRQRLMIARALVNKPRIIFFDEATSALDNETQRIVTESLDRMQATRIVIAHRLSTIINADKIYVLQNGELLQSGTYAELIDQPGPFADLAKRQLA
jgi:NHLM bacteriocin system ABC transporter ATP-binding protein